MRYIAWVRWWHSLLVAAGAGAATGGTAVARGEWPSDPIVQIGLFLGVATPAGLGGWLKLRDEMRTTEATQDSTFRERIAISDEIGGLRDKGVDEDDARLLTRLDFRKRLDERLAQFELLDRAPTGEVSPDPEVTTTATKLEVDELRRLLDESRLTTDILDARGWYLRGNALLAADRNEDALTAFDRAIASEPDVHQVHNNRGTVLGMLGRFEEVTLLTEGRSSSLQSRQARTSTEAYHWGGWVGGKTHCNRMIERRTAAKRLACTQQPRSSAVSTGATRRGTRRVRPDHRAQARPSWPPPESRHGPFSTRKAR